MSKKSFYKRYSELFELLYRSFLSPPPPLIRGRDCWYDYVINLMKIKFGQRVRQHTAMQIGRHISAKPKLRNHLFLRNILTLTPRPIAPFFKFMSHRKYLRPKWIAPSYHAAVRASSNRISRNVTQVGWAAVFLASDERSALYSVWF